MYIHLAKEGAMPAATVREFRAEIGPVLAYFMVKSSAIDSVCEAYSEEWRKYHSIQHILGMLRGAEQLSLSPDDRYRLSLLIIYHDVWYKIAREPGENERMSAEWAIRDLEPYSRNHERLPALLRQGIEATITHTLDGVEQEFVEVVSYLLDLDLWSLGQPAAIFQENTEAIWREFEPRYTRAEFDRGRSAWAATFLQRPHIYYTPHFKHLEAPARENLMALAG